MLQMKTVPVACLRNRTLKQFEIAIFRTCLISKHLKSVLKNSELSEISKLERNRLLSRMTSTAEQLMLEKKLVREQSKLLREQMCFLSELRELSFTKGDAKATREKLNSMFAVWQENLDALEKDMEVADQRWDVYAWFLFVC